jgi:cell division protein FtsL
MTRARLVWLLVLIVAVLASGVGVVYAKNQSRALFVESQKLRAGHDVAVAEWGRLQLELASEGSLEDVMRIAGGRLKMRPPNTDERVVVD